MEVVVLRWPRERDRRAALVSAGIPRLLLVDADATAPCPEDCLEDWLGMPATEDDIRSRVAALSVRGEAHRATKPELDGQGVMRFGGRWVALPPVEARLAQALLQRYCGVVTREQLARSGWPNGAPGRNALDVHMLRLRRRIAPLALVIRTVRSRGYLLEEERAQRAMALHNA